MEETIVAIHKEIRWLQENADTNDVNAISIHLNYLATHSFYFSELVSDAHAQSVKLEDEYKTACADYVSTGVGSAAKLEREAETKFAAKRKEYKEFEVGHQRLRMKLNRIDKVLDHYKQRVSVIKQTDMKNL